MASHEEARIWQVSLLSLFELSFKVQKFIWDGVCKDISDLGQNLKNDLNDYFSGK